MVAEAKLVSGNRSLKSSDGPAFQRGCKLFRIHFYFHCTSPPSRITKLGRGEGMNVDDRFERLCAGRFVQFFLRAAVFPHWAQLCHRGDDLPRQRTDCARIFVPSGGWLTGKDETAPWLEDPDDLSEGLLWVCLLYTSPSPRDS